MAFLSFPRASSYPRVTFFSFPFDYKESSAAVANPFPHSAHIKTTTLSVAMFRSCCYTLIGRIVDTFSPISLSVSLLREIVTSNWERDWSHGDKTYPLKVERLIKSFWAILLFLFGSCGHSFIDKEGSLENKSRKYMYFLFATRLNPADCWLIKKRRRVAI